MAHMKRTIPGYLTPKEAAVELECGRTYVYALIERDKLPTVRVSGRLLIPENHFDTFKATRRRRPKTTIQEGTDQ